jgi:general secretion pathway protein E
MHTGLDAAALEDRSGSAPRRDTGDVSAPAVRLLDRYLDEAVREGASDLHFEPSSRGLRVRARVDGLLREYETPPASLRAALLSRLKLVANVDLAQQRLPQDGSFSFAGHTGGQLDIRASFMPVVGGCKVALRIVQHGARRLELSELGMDRGALTALRTALSKPNGLIIAVGPTGSGKTTTLYSALGHLRDATSSIITVEDPVELRLDGISQVGVDDDVGRDFPTVLRSLLRQDPDVMMIGEIRDAMSARIACRAALTGHLVLSTLHTADCLEALVRLRDLEVADHLVGATVSLVVAQRLLRTLCSACASHRPVTTEERALFETAGVTAPRLLAAAKGCERCGGHGHKGRLAIFEILERAARGHAMARPARTLWQAGLETAASGRIDLGQVLTHCPTGE